MQSVKAFGFRKGFFETPTTATNGEWCRKYAKRGLIAGLVAALFVAVVMFASASVTNLAIVAAFIVVSVAAFSVCFSLFISRDVDFSGELRD